MFCWKHQHGCKNKLTTDTINPLKYTFTNYKPKWNPSNILKPSDWNNQAIYLLHLWEQWVANVPEKKHEAPIWPVTEKVKCSGGCWSLCSTCAWWWCFDRTRSYPVTSIANTFVNANTWCGSFAWQAALKLVDKKCLQSKMDIKN